MPIIFIFLIPLVSAQSISDVFSFIDAQTVFLLIAFGVFGLLLKVILDRFPAFHGTTAGIISVLLSLGMTWGINKWINVNDLFSNLGLSNDLVVYLPIALLILFIISLFIFKWKALFISGLLLILISFTDLVAEKETMLITGIVFVIISLIWWWKRRKKIPAGAISQKTPDTRQINGMPRLIAEAKAFRYNADKQQNPGMYRNWAHFINYLKSRGYGRNEKEICQRMNVTQKDISRAVKKYIR